MVALRSEFVRMQETIIYLFVYILAQYVLDVTKNTKMLPGKYNVIVSKFTAFNTVASTEQRGGHRQNGKLSSIKLQNSESLEPSLRELCFRR